MSLQSSETNLHHSATALQTIPQMYHSLTVWLLDPGFFRWGGLGGVIGRAFRVLVKEALLKLY